jgi:hypothetical protein
MKACPEKSKFFKIRTKISDILHEDLSISCCSQIHKFAIKVLLYKNKYIYDIDSDIWLNNTQKK